MKTSLIQLKSSLSNAIISKSTRQYYPWSRFPRDYTCKKTCGSLLWSYCKPFDAMLFSRHSRWHLQSYKSILDKGHNFTNHIQSLRLSINELIIVIKNISKVLYILFT